MKTLKPVLLLAVITLITALPAYSQSQAQMSDPSPSEVQAEATIRPTAATQEMKRAHTRLAKAQFTTHLSQNIQYPESMQRYGVEGTALVEVVITQEGKIKRTAIIESFSTEFDRAILKAVKNMKKIELKGSAYHGVSRIVVPVQFTLH